ncbi:hypothetical protein ACEWPM_015790 [Roseovarius sp. S4756]|uniref:hypothetical protein n=1 Tax=Roseovarius maritimus TaxID=3342637 RepID=UPI00372CA014
MIDALEIARLKSKQKMRARAERAILLAAPEHDQRNAALGILSDAEAQAVRGAVASARTAYHAEVAELDVILASDSAESEKLDQIRELDLRLAD